MKKLVLFLMLFVSLNAVAQITPLSYSEVIPVEGKTSAEIFGGLRQWVVTYYHNSKAVTQLEDPATGVIMLKAAFPFKKGMFLSAYNGLVTYELKLQCKDGRYKVEMSHFFHENEEGNAKDCSLGLLTTAEKCDRGGLNKATHTKVWKELKKASEADFANVVESLKNFNDFNSASDDDW